MKRKRTAVKRARWRDIKTAPKNGFPVLLYGRGRIGVGYYDPTPRLGGYGPWQWDLTYQPTHWMPLPTPPRSRRLAAIGEPTP